MLRLISTLAVVMLLAGCGGDDDDRPTPTPSQIVPGEATPTPTEVLPRASLIFVPGVAGTKLNVAGLEVWTSINLQVPDPLDLFLLALALDSDGNSPLGGIAAASAGDIILQERIGLPGIGLSDDHDFYNRAIEAFTSAGYAEGTSLFTFPYDWRLDVRDEAGRLADFIAEKAAAAPGGKVDVVAHSMGGLLSLVALNDERTEGKVQSFVTLGTPVLGATKALGVLRYHSICFTEQILDRWCVTNTLTAQQVMANFPGAYELLPSRDFDRAVGPPLREEDDLRGYDEWTQRIENAAMLALADDFHQNLPTTPADDSVRMLRIVGYRKSTPVQIQRVQVKDCFLSTPLCKEKTKTLALKGDGDGTVPRHSADLHNPATGFDATGGVETRTFPDVSHMGLAQDPDVLQAVLDFLSGAAGIDGKLASAAGAPGSRSDAPSQTDESFDGFELTTIGTLWGGITDPAGQRTGPLPGAPADLSYEGVPGSDYERYGDTQQFFVAAPGQYTGQFSVVSPGSDEYGYLEGMAGDDGLLEDVAIVQARAYRGGVVTKEAFYRVEPSPNLAVRVAFTEGSDPVELSVQVDRDGDGVFEDELPRSECINCFPPPEYTPTVPPPVPTETRFLVSVLNDQIQPDLIRKWDVASGAVIMTLVLEPRVQLADGSDFDGRYVATLLEQHADDLKIFEVISVEIVDPLTVQVRLGTGNTDAFLAALAKYPIEVRR